MTAIAATANHLRRRALTLGVANGIDYAVQLVLPMVLVRCLDTEAFGQYRLLWLVVGTVVALGTMAMPSSLFYFLPRADRPTRRLYVNQTLVFLSGAGLIAGCLVGPWNPWLPSAMRGLAQYGATVPAFVLLWVIASLLDLLPTVDERIGWQARAMISLAGLRAAALSATALLTGELAPLLWVLVAFVCFKAGVLVFYLAGPHGLGMPLLRRRTFVDQLRYAVPFGAGGALYVFRLQADQWVAATLFSIAAFAAFSIGAVLAPLLNVFRQAVSTAFLPSMRRLQAGGDLRGALALNSRANVLVGALVYPVLAFAFVFAEELVSIVYTAAYVQAADVIRVYVLGLAVLVVELVTVTLVLRQGPFVMKLNLLVLGASVALSWYAATRFGLAGAAAGSVAAAYVDRIATLWRISTLSGIAIRRLQDWRTLAVLALLATIAATCAWAVVGQWFTDEARLVRVIAGATVLAGVYAILYRTLPRLRTGGAQP